MKSKVSNQEMAGELAERIASNSQGRTITIMEVCGTHTMAIHRHGIPSLLPPNVRLISGPGCPVCVTSNEYIDKAIAYARHPDCILATFGDMLRVPGSSTSLAKVRAEGGSVQFLYSPRDALKLAASTPGKNVVFFGIGFETTAPTIAATVLEAEEMGLENFFLIPAMKVIPETLKVLVSSTELKLDGFLLPGHLSVITGTGIYEFLAREHRLACAVSGFEALDILTSISMIVDQIKNNAPAVENQYSRVVKPEGNVKAQKILSSVFEVVESSWRGIGVIPASGLRLRESYRRFDAKARIPVSQEETRESPGCICGMILRGLRKPPECPLYGKRCTPETPVGACMVSTEGTCAAYFKYFREE